MRQWQTLSLLFVMLAGSILSAHHSIAGAYDSVRRLTVEGSVVRFRFVNPHPFLEIEVKDADTGTVDLWHLEMDNRHELAEAGMTPETLRPLDRVEVFGMAHRREAHAMYVLKLRRPVDGFEYEQVGTSPRIKRPT